MEKQGLQARYTLIDLGTRLPTVGNSTPTVNATVGRSTPADPGTFTGSTVAIEGSVYRLNTKDTRSTSPRHRRETHRLTPPYYIYFCGGIIIWILLNISVAAL